MKYYVTFWLQSMFNGHGKFAVKCESIAQAQEIAADANSLHGVKYLKINKCGKLKRDYALISDAANYCRYL